MNIAEQYYPQLPLAIQIPESVDFDTFIPGDNQLLVQLLRRCAQKQGELQIYCWSEPGLGKTHLLQACCRDASQHGLSTCYLPLSQVLAHGPASFEHLEQLDVLCLDELQVLVEQAEFEQALFALINRCRAQETRLILAADHNIHALSWVLPDLASRLAWGPVFQIKALSDQDKIRALQVRAQQRGLQLPDDVGQYLLRHYHRELRSLYQQLDRLDRASLAAQRRLTVPFVKTVLQDTAVSE